MDTHTSRRLPVRLKRPWERDESESDHDEPPRKKRAVSGQVIVIDDDSKQSYVGSGTKEDPVRFPVWTSNNVIPSMDHKKCFVIEDDEESDASEERREVPVVDLESDEERSDDSDEERSGESDEEQGQGVRNHIYSLESDTDGSDDEAPFVYSQFAKLAETMDTRTAELQKEGLSGFSTQKVEELGRKSEHPNHPWRNYSSSSSDSRSSSPASAKETSVGGWAGSAVHGAQDTTQTGEENDSDHEEGTDNPFTSSTAGIKSRSDILSRSWERTVPESVGIETVLPGHAQLNPLQIKKKMFFEVHVPDMSRLKRRLASFRPETLEPAACWICPASKIRHCQWGALRTTYSFTVDGVRYNYALNAALIVLIAEDRLTKEQKEGIIMESWHVSHLRGDWSCTNPDHLTVELGKVNQSRNKCFHRGGTCTHTPTCIVHLRQADLYVTKLSEENTTEESHLQASGS
ncbi:hypothetical protein M011DRAFT_458439 [Sporormia fimetaria CBS 119925]|uniref:Zinc-binding loop region of homing endonuclease domain-containing protein n=1 Tax=Sporormia fimetaria CBS 119925 TaxID=1340428 RepID=A0A6A6VCZ6_9PLEO|nr:hypothetical protein M011DRAFT_458439 [Sporormia fimetaria CBS 119925]